MSVIGSFKAVSYIKEEAVNQLLGASHGDFGFNFRFASDITVPLTSLDGVHPSVHSAGTIYLANVTVKIQDRADTSVQAHLLAYGRVSLDYASEFATDVTFQIDADVTCPINFSIDSTTQAITLDSTNFTIDAVAITIFTPLSANLTTVLLGPDVRNALANELRRVSANLLHVTIPTDNLVTLEFSGTTAGFYILDVIYPRALKVLDGTLAVCWDDVESGTDTSGVSAPWTAFPLSADLAVLVGFDPAFVTDLADLNLRMALYTLAPFPDLNITTHTVTLFAGGLHVELECTINSGDDRVQMSFDALPAQEFGNWTVLVQNVHCKVKTGFFLFNWLSELKEETIEAKIAGPALLPILKTSFAAILPGLPALDQDVWHPAEFSRQGLEVGVSLASVIIDPSIVLAGGTGAASDFELPYNPDNPYSSDNPNALAVFSVAYPTLDYPASVSSPKGVSPSKSARPPRQIEWQDIGPFRIRQRFIQVEAGPHPELRRDPSLVLTWRITDPDGKLLWQNSGFADAKAPFTIDVWTSPMFSLTRFSLSCTVTRGSTELATYSIVIQIRDVLDRTHPYFHDNYPLQWGREVIENGKPVFKILGSKIRRSAIHKTALPGRCEFADKFKSFKHRMEYLDVLPPGAKTWLPASQDTGDFSIRLCQYCFFNGPDKAPKPLSNRKQLLVAKFIQELKG